MNTNPWFDPQSVHLTDPGTRAEGVNIYDIGGVREPEKEYDKYLKLVMAKSGKNWTLQDQTALNLLNYYAGLTGKTKYKRDSLGKVKPSTEKSRMPPAWS